MIGRNIEHFKILEILGEGGMGIVYKAFDLKLERYVAIKILNQQALKNPQFIARFKREARNQAKLTHSNIVTVYGFAEERGMLGIVMEFVDGDTLENLIQRKGKLDVEESLEILKQILVGVGYAHNQGFVHRDIKPSNVIINSDGIAKIMDFGISKSLNEAHGLTKTGTKIGTILYMSPEQIKALEPTSQSDIYSIGITFYEMLSGVTPFDRGTEFEIMEAHLKKAPPKISSKIPGIPGEVDALISKALSKTLAKRYHDCNEFLKDINQFSEKLIKTKTSRVSVEKKKELPKDNEKTILTKVRFYFFAFVFICILGGLFYFVYTTVSQYWDSSDKVLKDMDNNRAMYGSNPNYSIKSDWKNLKSPVSEALNSIYFITDNIGITCGGNGVLLKTINAGDTWNVLSDSSGINLYDINFVTPDRGFSVGENGTLLTTRDTGRTWQKINTPSNESFFKIYFLSNRMTGFIVGGKGTLLKSVDGGISWSIVSVPTNELLYSIDFTDDKNGTVVGWNGEILTTSDQGNSWSENEKITTQYLRDVKFINQEDGFICGGGGILLKTDDGGSSWEKVTSNTSTGLFKILFIGKKDGIILSNKGSVLVSNDGGDSWKITSSGKYTALNSATTNPSRKKIYLVGNNGTILTN